jgi:hypothetical protein
LSDCLIGLYVNKGIHDIHLFALSKFNFLVYYYHCPGPGRLRDPCLDADLSECDTFPLMIPCNRFLEASCLDIPFTFVDDGAGVIAAYALTLSNIACNWGDRVAAAAGAEAAEAAEAA